MTALLVVVFALVVPYLLLMLIVVAGLLALRGRRASPPPRTESPPAVSVIVPAHDEERTLGALLETLARQQYAGPLEFVIVDDRSTDGTAELVREFARNDARFRLVRVEAPNRRLAPKVNAVATGITASCGDVIVTTDADCTVPPGWVDGMVRYLLHDDDGRGAPVMAVGLVHAGGAPTPSITQRFEASDWLSLVLANRSMMHFGWAFSSSANNQAYRREAFDAAGGFGSAGRAPSGDEDLLVQRLAAHGRVVFADAPDVAVWTKPMPGLAALVRQRRRWASRYRHFQHFHPTFLAGILVLGGSSVALSAALAVSLVRPELLAWLLPLWGVKLAIEFTGMRLATTQLGRRELWGWPTVVWAVLHPFFMAAAVLGAAFRSGEWSAGARSYRRVLLSRRWRVVRRRFG